MKVTLEQIDELRNRVNVSYEEAKRTLEKNDGDLIKSIIELEKKKGRKFEKRGGFTAAANKILSLRMSVKSNEGSTILDIPFVVVLVAFALAFWIVIIGLVLATLTSCKIKIYKDRSLNVNNLKKNFQESMDKMKNKSEEIFKEDIGVDKDKDEDEDIENEENEIIIE